MLRRALVLAVLLIGLLGGEGRLAPVAQAAAPAPRPGELSRRTLNGDPALDYYLYVPRAGGRGAPLLVAVHGISRDATGQAKLFSPLAEKNGVVLVAPLFTSRRFDDYQRLGRSSRGARADRALERLIDEVARLTSARTERIYLFGYSGGAQFVHRYAMAHPARVASVVASSAGWYTFPDPRLPYPYGIAATPELPDLSLDPKAFLRVPFLVTVGDRDLERNGSLASSPELDRQQGRTRVERARRWVTAMKEAARSRGIPAEIELETLPRAEHSFRENAEETALRELAFQHLFGANPSGKSGRQARASDRAEK